jgi:hypothetical protein
VEKIIVSFVQTLNSKCPHFASQNIQLKAEIRSVVELLSDVGTEITEQASANPALLCAT